MKIEIGVFAHNEEANIVKTINNLLSQDIFEYPEYDIVCHILANGCTDNTVTNAAAAINMNSQFNKIQIHDLPLGGKSRTWNKYVHELARFDCDALIFLDADIEIINKDNINRMLECINGSNRPVICSSKPVKDINYFSSAKKSVLDKIIGSSADGLNDWTKSVCGSLYVLKGNIARSIYLPIGLPVEDGFMCALISTDFFDKSDGNVNRIENIEGIFHLYESERTLLGLINHQTRIVVGSSINTVLFGELWKIGDKPKVQQFLKEISSDDQWINRTIAEKLPDTKFGYVPWHFLTKRMVRWSGSSHKFSIRSMVITIIGTTFDTLVFFRAQIAMFRGAGAGYW
jgi:glycosyltransferase involved in cell wall biosynthesis